MKFKIALAITIIGITLLSFYFFTFMKIKRNVEDLYELANPGTTAEVVAINLEGSLFKVLVKLTTPAQTRYVEAWISLDGSLLTQNVILVKESVEKMSRLREFVNCLDQKNLKIYGITNHTTTLLQLNLLGSYSPKLFIACDGELVQNCIQANVSVIPSIVFEGKVYPGLKDINWLENLTKCHF